MFGQNKNIMKKYFQNIALSLFVILLTAYSQLILRFRMTTLDTSFSFENINFSLLYELATDFWLLSSIVAFLASFVCWSFALSNNSQMTRHYPIIVSISIFFVSFLNYLIFQDEMTFYNILGVALLFVGIFLLLK